MQVLRIFFALAFTANGMVMLALPEWWYATIPGVIATGPLNAHFVRDVGAAYLLCGVAFFWLWRDAIRAWPAALGACFFLLLHAAIHIAEFMGGVQTFEHLVGDLPAVLFLPAVALWSAWPRAGQGVPT